VLHTSSAALLGGGGEGIGDAGLRVVAAASSIAGLSGFAAQIITVCSLLHFQPHAAAHAAAPSSPPRAAAARALARPTAAKRRRRRVLTARKIEE
jgi:hypothetical protein